MPDLSETSQRPWQDAARIQCDPAYAEMVCHCERISMGEIRDALASPLAPATLGGLKRRTRVMFGRCQGFYCGARVQALLDDRRGALTWSQDADPRVLIVGAGPAGLAAAHALARQGIDGILVIDRDDEPGGLPRYCHHPGFGLEYARWPYTGPGFAKRLLSDLKGTDVRIECRTTLLSLRDGPEAELVGPAFGLRRMRPQAVIIATGIRESNRGNLAVPGGRAEAGILTTGQLQQIVARKVALPKHMKSIIVVGTEHVAFSAIWTARQAGLRVTTMIGDEDRIMSFAPLGALARVCGTAVLTGSSVREIETKGGAVVAAIVDTPQGTRRLATDGILFTANWIPETAALAGGPVALDARTAGPRIDQAMRTSGRGIFAAGNVLHGVEFERLVRQGRPPCRR